MSPEEYDSAIETLVQLGAEENEASRMVSGWPGPLTELVQKFPAMRREARRRIGRSGRSVKQELVDVFNEAANEERLALGPRIDLDNKKPERSDYMREVDAVIDYMRSHPDVTFEQANRAVGVHDFTRPSQAEREAEVVITKIRDESAGRVFQYQREHDVSYEEAAIAVARQKRNH